MASFSNLVGQIITKIEGKKGDERLIFHTLDNKQYIMYHSQDCCEHVYLEDICGDLSDLIGSPVLNA